jgi:hypothetical protein
MYFETGGVFIWDETVFSREENVLKQWASYPCLQRLGDGQMQYLFELIWTQSCSRYLASMGQQEAQRCVRIVKT